MKRIGGAMSQILLWTLMQLLATIAAPRPLLYLPSEVPNPRKDPLACGAITSSPNQVICDPHGILNSDQRALVGTHVQNFVENVDASKLGCQEPVSPSLEVAIAILQKMNLGGPEAESALEMNNELDDAIAAAVKKYATRAHDAWGVGNEVEGCGGTGILLFLSVEDRASYISIGSALQGVLADERLETVLQNMGSKLRQMKYSDALIGALDNMKDFVERGPPGIWERILPTLIVAGILAAIFFLIYLSAKKERQNALIQSQLNRLEQDRALALQGNYRCTSCPICLEDFPAPERESEQGDSNAASNEPLLHRLGSDGLPLRLLRCGHVFDESCFTDWVVSGNGNNRRNCPICREDVTGSSDASTPASTLVDGINQTTRGLQTESGGTLDSPVTRRRRSDNLSSAIRRATEASVYQHELRFRLGRLRARYPNDLSETQVNRWSNTEYRGRMETTHTAQESNARMRNAHDSGNSLGSNMGSFGGGKSSGGRGGRW